MADLFHTLNTVNIDDTETRICRYDMNNLNVGSKIACIGPTNSGKSFFARNEILWVLRNQVFFGLSVSYSEHYEQFYKEFILDIFVYDDFSEDVLENIFDRQDEINSLFKEHPGIVKKYNLKKELLVIADDCMHSKSWKRSELTNFMFSAGRHAHITFLFMMQYPLGIKPDLRTNIQHVFIFRDDDPSNRKRIFENYTSGIVPSLKIFNMLMDRLSSEDKICLVVDRTVKRRKHWSENVFWHKASPKGDFMFGAKMIWDYHLSNYYKNYRKRQMRRKKNLTKVAGSGVKGVDAPTKIVLTRKR